MNPRFRALRTAISSLRLFPHLLLMLSMSNKDIVKADLARWAEALNLGAPRTHSDFVRVFITLMTFTPEYRNVFYLRCGIKSWFFRWLCPGLESLSIVSERIGPGLFIQHGENTFVFADSIGANCWIGRHVVVGFSNETDRPTIGNNVKIFAGAKIVGKVMIGDNATIGLNTVILDSVEPGATMLGVPGKVVWRTKSSQL